MGLRSRIALLLSTFIAVGVAATVLLALLLMADNAPEVRLRCANRGATRAR